ncbi:MAG: hypothetical protein EGS62_11940 [Ruminococcus sp.]|nr:hypothetical protein [Ruminococcus sp.]
MPDEKVLQVAILIWGCAFCAIAALCIFLSSNYFKKYFLLLLGPSCDTSGISFNIALVRGELNFI